MRWNLDPAHTSITFEGKLNRKDFGLTWNMVLETGGLLVGEEVRFSVDAELVAAREAVGT
jgi:polyisoprenoid-binding protein YceI